jgi:hypothetical protein
MHEAGCNVWSANLEGFVASRQMDRTTANAKAYIQFFRDGSIEYVSTYWFRQNEGGKWFMSSVEHERYLIGLLPRVLSVQKQLGVEPPLSICLSIIGARGYFLNVDQRLLFAAIPGQPTNRFDRDRIELRDFVIEKFDIDAAQVMRPSFDAIWNAAGWSESFNYDESGKWVGQRR